MRTKGELHQVCAQQQQPNDDDDNGGSGDSSGGRELSIWLTAVVIAQAEESVTQVVSGKSHIIIHTRARTQQSYGI